MVPKAFNCLEYIQALWLNWGCASATYSGRVVKRWSQLKIYISALSAWWVGRCFRERGGERQLLPAGDVVDDSRPFYTLRTKPTIAWFLSFFLSFFCDVSHEFHPIVPQDSDAAEMEAEPESSLSISFPTINNVIFYCIIYLGSEILVAPKLRHGGQFFSTMAI